MGRPRVLITGPVEHLDEWCAAARTAAWEPLPWALIEIEEHAPLESQSRAVALALPRHLCVTSVHAVAFLEALARRAPALRALPCSVVGQRSAQRLAQLGFTGEIGVYAGAEALCDALCARAARPASVLWPRGDRSDELAKELRAAGIEVEDPVAYTNRPRAAGERPPECELVFFASPSAVHAWRESEAGHRAQRALAIGPTTLEALLGLKSLAFFDIISLPEPTSSAFAAALQHIDTRSTP